VLGSGLLVTGEGLPIEEPLMAGGFGGGGGADEAAASFRLQTEDDVRQDFRDTAYWEAKLITDESGRASVEIPLPDNVTTWRLHSKAATNDTQVGQASADILARLPLIIRPITPRFFTAGDQVALGANVNNNTDAAIEADGYAGGSWPVRSTARRPRPSPSRPAAARWCAGMSPLRTYPPPT
jgi:uncharacterized protein YfaS (alpha-2-macroglobulin family)